MIFKSKDGTEFTLKILGYTYPTATDYTDLNWLTISLTVSKQEKTWSWQGPILQPFELNRLLDWLPLIQKDRLEFNEPALAFSRKGFWTQGVIFHLHFFYECPITAIFPDILEDDDGCPFIELQVSHEGLLSAQHALKDMLSTYPQKDINLFKEGSVL